MYNGPIRGGSRGGRDQFNWESVKADKDRVFYLGHSVKASVGRWQKDKDLYWYTRTKADKQGELDSERKAVKQKEEDIMLEALGLKKKSSAAVVERKLEGHELQELLKRGGEDEDTAHGQDNTEADRVRGLGFKPGNVVGVAVHEVLEGFGLDHKEVRPTISARLDDGHNGEAHLHSLSNRMVKKKKRSKEKGVHKSRKKLKKEGSSKGKRAKEKKK